MKEEILASTAKRGDVPMFKNSIHIYNRTYAALESLYLNCREVQLLPEVQKFSAPDGNLAFAKEFCTIKVCGPRQSGHTQSIVRLLIDYPLPSVVIYPNLDMANYFKHRLPARFVEENNLHFASIHNFETALRGLDVNRIIVDCAFMFSESKIENLYKAAIPCMKHHKEWYFIFVG